MIYDKKEIKNQSTLCITVCALISYLPITNFINDVFNKFVGAGFIYDSLFCYILLLIFIIKSLFIVIAKGKSDVFLFSFFMLASWVITYICFPQNHEEMLTSLSDVMGNPFYILFVFSFSGYVFSRYITDYELFENIFLKFAIVVVIGSTVSFFLTLNRNFQKQYMVFSYNMLVHVVMLIIYYFEKKNPIYLAVGALGFLMMVMAGCRGAIVSCIGSFALYFLFRKAKLSRKLALISIICILLYIIITNFQNIISWIANVAYRLHIDSRVIRLLESGEFLYESGRDAIRSKIVSEYNFFGHGLYGDRVLSGGSYAHNFIVEIIAQFGYIFGIPILGIVFILIASGLFARDKKLRNMIIIFLSAGLFKLFFSGSYLNQEPSFYVLLGMCINAITIRRKI